MVGLFPTLAVCSGSWLLVPAAPIWEEFITGNYRLWLSLAVLRGLLILRTFAIAAAVEGS